MTDFVLQCILGVVLVGIIGAILTPATRKYPKATTAIVAGGLMVVIAIGVKLWLL